jgi:urease accessory protein
MMHYSQSVPLVPWRAELALEFEMRAQRTVLSARRHDGPLVIQKLLYPEGDEICHAIVVHPPGGIAGGDELEFKARLGLNAQALLTTPGAGKWYRSNGSMARQSIQFDLSMGACLEWLPQENILFSGACAELATTVRLSGDATFIGWEVCCFGRSGSGENFATGNFIGRLLVERDGRPLRWENIRLEGGGAALQSPVVLAGQTVAGTFIVASAKLDSPVLGICRQVQPVTGDGAVTLLPGLLVGRYLGGSSEAAKNYFIELWHTLRPMVAGRDAIDPRIWRT